MALQNTKAETLDNETRKAEQRKQRGLWQRRHRLNIVERDTFMQLNKKYGTYTGPKQ